MQRVTLRRQLDCRHNKTEIQMDRALDAADAFYAGATARITSAPGLYFVPFGMSNDKVVLHGCRSGRVDLHALMIIDAAGLTEHAQVQRDSADKKD